jgi:hypothetical protein
MASTKQLDLTTLQLPVHPGSPGQIMSAQQAVAMLFELEPPTKQERELAHVAREHLVLIALAGQKAKIGAGELTTLAVHTSNMFERGSGQILGHLERPKVNQAHTVLTAQFSAAMLQGLSTWLQGAANNGADAINDAMSRPIELRQQSLIRQALGLLMGL